MTLTFQAVKQPRERGRDTLQSLKIQTLRMALSSWNSWESLSPARAAWLVDSSALPFVLKRTLHLL